MSNPCKVLEFIPVTEMEENSRRLEASAAVWKRAYEREHAVANQYRRTMRDAYRDKLDRWERDAQAQRDRVTLAWAAFASALAIGLLIARWF